MVALEVMSLGLVPFEYHLSAQPPVRPLGESFGLETELHYQASEINPHMNYAFSPPEVRQQITPSAPRW